MVRLLWWLLFVAVVFGAVGNIGLVDKYPDSTTSFVCSDNLALLRVLGVGCCVRLYLLCVLVKETEGYKTLVVINQCNR